MRKAFALAILVLCLHAPLGAARSACAQSWTPNPIRIIIPFPPGGTTDQIARRVQPLLQAELKTPIVIENRAGASGAIGTNAAATAAPDGTTFVLVFDTHGVNPSLLPSLPFDTVRDLAPVMLIGTSPMVITAYPGSAFTRFDDAIGAAKKQPGVTYGTVGAGSLAHLAMTRIANKLGIVMTHIPYKGGGPLVTDAIAGHVPLVIASIALLSPHIAAAALRPLVVTSAQRYSRLPDTPALSELGISGVEADSWWGMLAPARTPADVISRMNAALAKALREPMVEQGLSEQGIVYRLSKPEEFGAFINDEIARWAAVIKENKIVASD